MNITNFEIDYKNEIIFIVKENKRLSFYEELKKTNLFKEEKNNIFQYLFFNDFEKISNDRLIIPNYNIYTDISSNIENETKLLEVISKYSFNLSFTLYKFVKNEKDFFHIFLFLRKKIFYNNLISIKSYEDFLKLYKKYDFKEQEVKNMNLSNYYIEYSTNNFLKKTKINNNLYNLEVVFFKYFKTHNFFFIVDYKNNFSKYERIFKDIEYCDNKNKFKNFTKPFFIPLDDIDIELFVLFFDSINFFENANKIINKKNFLKINDFTNIVLNKDFTFKFNYFSIPTFFSNNLYSLFIELKNNIEYFNFKKIDISKYKSIIVDNYVNNIIKDKIDNIEIITYQDFKEDNIEEDYIIYFNSYYDLYHFLFNK